MQADNLTVPGIGGDQQLVVTSTGLNNQSSLLGQDASERIQSVRRPEARLPARSCVAPEQAVRRSAAVADTSVGPVRAQTACKQGLACSPAGRLRPTRAGAQVVGHAVGEGNPFEQLYRVLFWIAILLAGITLVQLAATGLYMYARAKRPALLCFPRPQLFVTMLGLPALIQASARAPPQRRPSQASCVLHCCTRPHSSVTPGHPWTLCELDRHAGTVWRVSDAQAVLPSPCAELPVRLRAPRPAEMFSHGGKALVAGVVIVIVMPILFAAFLCYFVYAYLYRKHMRAAAFILRDDPDEVRWPSGVGGCCLQDWQDQPGAGRTRLQPGRLSSPACLPACCAAGACGRSRLARLGRSQDWWTVQTRVPPAEAGHVLTAWPPTDGQEGAADSMGPVQGRAAGPSRGGGRLAAPEAA